LAMGLPDLLGLFPSSKQSRSICSISSMTLVWLVIYMVSGFLPLQTGGLRDVVLATLALSVWLIWDRTPLTFLLGTVAAAGGASVEIFLVSKGVFYYLSPNFFGIASWIPWLYFASMVPVRALSSRLRNESIVRDLQTL